MLGAIGSNTWRSSRGCDRSTANVQINVAFRADESDEHLVINEIRHDVCVGAVRRCVEDEDSGPDVVKLPAKHSYLKSDSDDVETQQRWTPTEGCNARESTHGNKHAMRCAAHRYEYSLKYGRDPPATPRRVRHEPERELLCEQDLSGGDESCVRSRYRASCAIPINSKRTDRDRTNFPHTSGTSTTGRKATRGE